MLYTIQNSGLRWLWLSALVIVADQVTKQLVVREMALYESMALLPFFNLTHVHNYGAAFSILSEAGGWQRWFFIALATGISGLLLRWMYLAKSSQQLLAFAYALVLGGAIGNVADRVIYGYVIDFLDFYYQQWHWPTFNLADSAIFVGAACLIYDAVKHPDANQDAVSSTASSD